jgi:hypothetical protein
MYVYVTYPWQLDPTYLYHIFNSHPIRVIVALIQIAGCPTYLYHVA